MICRIIITRWAFESYLELLHGKAFSSEEYWEVLRPDVERLKAFTTDPKFKVAKFWSIATLQGQQISNGFKMKWHNIGNGKVQIRLLVAVLNKEAFLCRAFVKGDAKAEARELNRFEIHIEQIQQGRYKFLGEL